MTANRSSWKLTCLCRQAARPRDVVSALAELGQGRLDHAAQAALVNVLQALQAADVQRDINYEGCETLALLSAAVWPLERFAFLPWRAARPLITLYDARCVSALQPGA